MISEKFQKPGLKKASNQLPFIIIITIIIIVFVITIIIINLILLMNKTIFFRQTYKNGIPHKI